MDKCIQEVKLREELLSKVRKGGRLTREERFWCVTHPVYNSMYGPPILNSSIETLKPNKWHTVIVKNEYTGYTGRIIPVISAPASKGHIVTNSNVSDDFSSKKVIRMLGLNFDFDIQKRAVEYRSQLGLLGVDYQCDYFDPKMRLHMRECSSTGNPHFAMKREQVAENAVRYYCKSPVSDSFNALIFVIEWLESQSK